jgi:hypothetical protein
LAAGFLAADFFFAAGFFAAFLTAMVTTPFSDEQENAPRGATTTPRSTP